MHSLTDIKTYGDDSDDSEVLVQGGYAAERIIDLLQDNKKQDTLMEGGNPLYSDNLRELLKDLYVPIGLFTHIKPCSTRSFEHSGACISDSMFDELDKLTSVAYKMGGTRKNAQTAEKQTKRHKDKLKTLK